MEEKKQGPLAKLFGRKHSGCCDVKVEEIDEGAPGEREGKCCGEVGAAAEKEAPTPRETKDPEQGPCCGGAATSKPGSRCCG